MKHITLLLGLLLLNASNSISGELIYYIPDNDIITTVDDDNELKKKWDAALGSFQFEILKEHNGDRNVQIHMEIINEIEANRHETEVVYISYNEFMRIKILPKNVISGDYNKLELMKKVDSFE